MLVWRAEGPGLMNSAMDHGAPPGVALIIAFLWTQNKHKYYVTLFLKF